MEKYMHGITKLVIIDRKGEEHTVKGQAGASVMEIIRDSGLDELLALCGGSCSCATCHVYVDPEFAPHLSLMSEDESDLLDSSSHRDDRSRLSCQIVLSDEHNGMRVIIAPED